MQRWEPPIHFTPHKGLVEAFHLVDDVMVRLMHVGALFLDEEYVNKVIWDIHVGKRPSVWENSVHRTMEDVLFLAEKLATYELDQHRTLELGQEHMQEQMAQLVTILWALDEVTQNSVGFPHELESIRATCDVLRTRAQSLLDRLESYPDLSLKPGVCFGCHSQGTLVELPSWSHLERTMAAVVTLMGLLETPPRSMPDEKDEQDDCGGETLHVDPGADIWSELMMEDLYQYCHPLSAMEDRLEACPVFTTELLGNLKELAITTIHKHMFTLMESHGVSRPCTVPRQTMGVVSARLWLRELENDNDFSEDIRVMAEHGLSVIELGDALTPQFVFDESVSCASASRLKLTALEREARSLKAQLVEVSEQNKNLAQMVQELSIPQRLVTQGKPCACVHISDDDNMFW